MEENKILQCRNLDISFVTPKGNAHIIRGIDFDLERGRTLAIVGESGSGKSITMKAIMGILPDNAVINSGEINFSYNDSKGTKKSIDLLKLSAAERTSHINGKRIAMVFQDPMTSLNPTMRIGNQIMESLKRHLGMSKEDAKKRAIELLELVGIKNAKERMKNYPHQFSGGMRQRVVIAIALSCNPDILICDEPTTALDVTIQAKILALIKDLQKKLQFSVVFITHDLGAVAAIADEVAVMYMGKIIEKGTVFDIFCDPRHPYTWGLLMSIPDIGYHNERLFTIKGMPPEMFEEIKGDAFCERNPYALKIDCKEQSPMFQISDTHYAATWLLDKRAPEVKMPRELKEYIMKMQDGGRMYESNIAT